MSFIHRDYHSFYQRAVLLLVLHTATDSLLVLDPQRLELAFFKNVRKANRYQAAVLDSLWNTTNRGQRALVAQDFDISRFRLWREYSRLFDHDRPKAQSVYDQVTDEEFQAFHHLCRQDRKTYNAWSDELLQTLPLLRDSLSRRSPVSTNDSEKISLVDRCRISDEDRVCVAWQHFQSKLSWMHPADWIMIGLSFAGVVGSSSILRTDLYEHVLEQWDSPQRPVQLMVLTTAIALLGPAFAKSFGAVEAMEPDELIEEMRSPRVTRGVLATLLVVQPAFLKVHPVSDIVVKLSTDFRAPFQEMVFENSKMSEIWEHYLRITPHLPARNKVSKIEDTLTAINENTPTKQNALEELKSPVEASCQHSVTKV